MSLRIRRVCENSRGPILAIVGGAHVEGIRRILESPPEIASHTAMGLSILLDDAESLFRVWRENLGVDVFSQSVPREIQNPHLVASQLATGIIRGHDRISVWVEETGEWQVVDTTKFEDFSETSVGNLMKMLVDGFVDPYTLRRIDSQGHLPKDV